MRINNSKYSLTMSKNGRLGGLAKGEAYKNKKRKAQEIYISNIDITIKEIAEKLGVSVGFVSDCTKQQIIKKLRYSQNHNIQDLLKLNDEQFEALTLQDDMLQDLKKMKRIKESDDYKQLKKSNLLKF